MPHHIPKLFDTNQIGRQHKRAANNLKKHNFLFDRAAEALAERLSEVKRDFPLALQIGARASPDTDKAIKKEGGIETLVHTDLSEDVLSSRGNLKVQTDAESLPFPPETFDLVLSPLALHTVNDLPGMLVQIRRVLKPDGLFLGVMPGGETLKELRDVMMRAEMSIKGGVSPRVIPFIGRRDAGALLQRAEFGLPVVDSDILTVTYEHPLKLMHELRGMGGSNILHERPRANPGKAFFAETIRLYQETYAESDGRISATVELVFLSGWAPHESQPKPLRRGSGEVSLGVVLSNNSS